MRHVLTVALLLAATVRPGWEGYHCYLDSCWLVGRFKTFEACDRATRNRGYCVPTQKVHG